MMDAIEQLAGRNIDSPVIEVEHASLTRASNESLYRSFCPVCKEGILLLRRDSTSIKLMRDDYCTLCAQHIRYIGELGFFDEEKPDDNGVTK